MTIAEDMNITDIYAQVVVSGYAYYHSRILPRSQYLSRISGSKYDPLAAVIKEAKKRSMRVHAWINCFVVWSLKDPPDSARHVYHLHPEWFIKDLRGRSIHDYSYAEWNHWGLEGLYLDPAHPEVQRYLLAICAEIAGKYAVDGVHLDFIRYPGILWGFNEPDASLIPYVAETDTMRWLDLTRYPRLSFYHRWLAWRLWQATRARESIIKGLVQKIKPAVENTARAHSCVLTAAVFPNPALARYSFAQNWTEWQEAIDYPVVMAYTPDIGFFGDIVNYTASRRSEAIYGIGLIWPNMEDEAVWEIRRVQENNGAGICFFEYTTLDTLVDREWIKNDLIRKPESLTLDTSRYALLANAFIDTALAGLPLTDETGSIRELSSEFTAYLSSLSLKPTQDLARLGLTQNEFGRRVISDVSGFMALDREWNKSGQTIHYLDDLVQPPFCIVEYEFLPWLSDSDSVIIRCAGKTRNLTHKDTIYLRPMDKFSRAVFSTPTGVQTSVATPAGIYVFQVQQRDAGGRIVPRPQIKAEFLPVFESWTCQRHLRSWFNLK